MKRPAHDLISVTARLAAYYRAFSDIPFATDVASFIDAQATFDALVHDHGIDARALHEYAPMFEARYKSIAAVLRKLGATQVLELASGFSLRGLALTRDHEMRYVESDLAAVNAEKQRLIDSLSVATRGEHSVVTANALDEEQLRSAILPFDRSRELFVVCEGLLMYLRIDEREQLARSIRASMSEFAGGAWLTPDFAMRVDAAAVSEERKRMRAAVAGVTERQLNEGAFESQAEMDAFFRRHDFRAERLDQIDEAGALVSPERIGVSAQHVDRLRGKLGLWVMHATRAHRRA